MSNTTNTDQLLRFSTAFDQLAAQGGQSPYTIEIVTISVLDALKNDYKLSDPETKYGKSVKTLTAPNGKSVTLQSSGNTTIVIRECAEDTEFEIDGKKITVKKGKMKGYVI